MGGRGAKSPQAKRYVENVSHKALLWAKSKIGNHSYGRWAWKGVFTQEQQSAICLLNMLTTREILKKNPSHLHHPVRY